MDNDVLRHHRVQVAVGIVAVLAEGLTIVHAVVARATEAVLVQGDSVTGFEPTSDCMLIEFFDDA
jgi:hypothetical protein